MAHRLIELGLLPLRGPCATVPPQPLETAAATAAAAALRLQGVGQVRRTRVVRAVAVAEEGERPQEIPRVAPLRCEAGKGLMQRLCGPFAVGRGHAAEVCIAVHVARFAARTLGGCIRHRRLEAWLRARRWMLPVMPAGARGRLFAPPDQRVASCG